jgi:hypothetical protein
VHQACRYIFDRSLDGQVYAALGEILQQRAKREIEAIDGELGIEFPGVLTSLRTNPRDGADRLGL